MLAFSSCPPVKPLSLLRSFRSRNYRLFFFGQSISLIGGWMATTASMWLAYRLTDDPFYVGAVGFCSQIPLLFMAPFTSVIGDRVNRRRLLVGLQICSLIQMATLATVVFTGVVTVQIMMALALVQGVINAFEFPVRQSFVVEMVNDKADLPNALALNSSMFNIARLIGPTLAGLFIELWGEAVCYAINAVSYTAVIYSLLKMQLRPWVPRLVKTRPWEDFCAGLRYVKNDGSLMRPLLLVAIVAFAGFGAHTLAPVVARTLFEGEASLLGRFYSIVGIGALISAVIMGTRSSPSVLRPWVVRGTFCGTAGTLIVGLSSVLWLTYVGYFVCGLAVVLVMVGCNTLIQSRVDDDKRSRVMGLFVMATGIAPIGQFFTGLAASAWGTRTALILCTVILAGAALAYAKPRSPVVTDPVDPVDRARPPVPPPV